jgi:hypothetical protein
VAKNNKSPKPGKRPRKPLENTPPARSLLTPAVVLSIIGLLKDALRYSFMFGIALCAYGSVREMAGKKTDADIKVGFFSKITWSDSVAVIFGGGGAAYGLAERQVRKSKVKQMAERIHALEKMIDPARTSSNLTEHGNTNPEDAA